MGASKGVVRRLPVGKSTIYDYIPVDVVVNQILVTAWYVHEKRYVLAIKKHTITHVNTRFIFTELEIYRYSTQPAALVIRSDGKLSLKTFLSIFMRIPWEVPFGNQNTILLTLSLNLRFFFNKNLGIPILNSIHHWWCLRFLLYFCISYRRFSWICFWKLRVGVPCKICFKLDCHFFLIQIWFQLNSSTQEHLELFESLGKVYLHRMEIRQQENNGTELSVINGRQRAVFHWYDIVEMGRVLWKFGQRCTALLE